MATTVPVWVWLPGQQQPVEAAAVEPGRFQYLPGYKDVANAVALDPIALPITRKASPQTVLSPAGLPGVLMDACPAGYGKDRLVAVHGELTPLQLLELGPGDTVGGLEVCADIERKKAWRARPLADLVSLMLDLEEDAPSSRAIRLLLDDGTTSAGGERPKVTVEADGRLWLAKLQARGDGPHVPAREYAVMEMARSLGLHVPEVRLERHGDREVFLIDRFDRRGDPSCPERLLVASAHTVLGLMPSSISGDARRSYLVLADKMRRWIADARGREEDTAELWQRMAYNALVGNADDHPRNHALVHDVGGWRLSPAYDIVSFHTFSRVMALSVHEDGSQRAEPRTLLESAPHFGLPVTGAAQWLGEAAHAVASEWQGRYRDAGVAPAVVAMFEPAFQLATEIAESGHELMDLAEEITRETAGARRRRAGRLARDS